MIPATRAAASADVMTGRTSKRKAYVVGAIPGNCPEPRPLEMTAVKLCGWHRSGANYNSARTDCFPAEGNIERLKIQVRTDFSLDTFLTAPRESMAGPQQDAPRARTFVV